MKNYEAKITDLQKLTTDKNKLTTEQQALVDKYQEKHKNIDFAFYVPHGKDLFLIGGKDKETKKPVYLIVAKPCYQQSLLDLLKNKVLVDKIAKGTLTDDNFIIARDNTSAPVVDIESVKAVFGIIDNDND